MIRSLSVLALAAGMATASCAAWAQNFNGTCTNVHYEGPRLVAVCLNALGVPQASSIDVRTCPPSAVGNANGNLVCTAGSGGGYGGYGGYDEYGGPRGYRRGYGY